MSTKLVNSIVFGKKFCRLCFSDVYDDGLRFHDEVILNLKSEKISYMLVYILGGKYTSSMRVRDIFCDICVQSLKNSYNFIRMCKNNSDRLEKTVVTLNEALQSADFSETSKSVLIQIDTTDYSYMQFYQYQRTVKSVSPSEVRGHSKYLISRAENKTSAQVSYADITGGQPVLEKNPKKPEMLKNSHTTNSSKTQAKCSLEERQQKLKMLIQNQQTVKSPPIRYVSPSEVRGHSKYLISRAKNKTPAQVSHADTTRVQSVSKKNPKKLAMLKNSHTKNSSKTQAKYSREERQQKLEMLVQNQSQYNLRKKRKLSNKNNQRQEEEIKPAKKLTKKERNKIIELATKKLLRIKTERKKFVCNECEKTFDRRSSIVNHMQNIHLLCQPFSCEYCDNTFHNAKKLKHHVRKFHVHFSAQCDICNARFKQVDSVYKHRKRHFNPKSELYVENITK